MNCEPRLPQKNIVLNSIEKAWLEISTRVGHGDEKLVFLPIRNTRAHTLFVVPLLLRTTIERQE